MESNYTDNFYYYIDYLSDQSTLETENTVVVQNSNKTISKPNIFPIENSKTPIKNYEMSKLIRLASFLVFFLLVILVIFLLSKLYACLYGAKKRKKRYGYYFNNKLETILADFGTKVKYEKLKLEVKITKNNQSKANTTNTVFSNDTGHINESFDPYNELVIIDDISVSKSSNYELKNKPKKTPANFLTRCLETKRINSFDYEKFSNENDSESIFDFPTKQTKLNMMEKFFKKNIINRETSMPLFTISNSSSSRSSKSKSSTSSSGIDLSFSNSFSGHSVNSTSFELPIILITDTSQMSTSIIDLETFEPENYTRSSNDFLVKYRINT